ncbi:unnamed protein product, partial [Echinostoma caproni]|uniref:VWFD domain-containing protein n=1 Tax=Echinostoma caproni TaxID=27848 RepID=A0A183A452_9TREM
MNSVSIEVPYSRLSPDKLIEPKGLEEAYAFLEYGPDFTLSAVKTANTLGIEVPVTRLRTTILARTTCETNSEVNFAVPSLGGGYQLQVEKAYKLQLSAD